jgi:hypothetical protein
LPSAIEQFKQSKQQKDWEVTAYMDIMEGEVYQTKKKTVIKSVRRLSDGEVFSIGDEVFFDKSGAIGRYKIPKFIIEGSIMIVNGDKYSEYLNKIGHVFKQPFFTTEDGVVFSEDDKMFVLSTYSWIVSSNPLNVCQSPFEGEKNQFQIFLNQRTPQKNIELKINPAYPTTILKKPVT